MIQPIKTVFVGLLITLPIMLIGCSTKYEEIDLANNAHWLEPNVLEIATSGNAYTSDKKITEFAYLYAAEQGLLKGYSYFVIESIKNTNVTMPTTEYTDSDSNNSYSFELGQRRSTNGLKINTLNAPERKIVFRLFNEQSENMGDLKLHDLMAIYHNLGREHKPDFSATTPPN